jgi:DNA-binding transcriptional LysR family regulator
MGHAGGPVSGDRPRPVELKSNSTAMSVYNFNSIFHQVDLSLLRHFFAIATFGGFSKASRATGVSQPALSLGLKKLEKSLGVVLINRSARPFELTPAGVALFNFCHHFEGGLESVMSSIGASLSPEKKRLRLGTALSIGFGPIAELCAKITAEKETFELELSEQNTYQLLSDVRDGRLDAAVVPNDVFDNRLMFSTLQRDQVIFVVGKIHRDTFSRGHWKKAASQLPLITFPRETPMRTLTDKICVTEQVEFKTIFAVNSIEALKLLVEQSQGGAFVLKALVAQELISKRLFEETLPIRLPKSGIALVLPKIESQSAGSKYLSKLIKAKIRVGNSRTPLKIGKKNPLRKISEGSN